MLNALIRHQRTWNSELGGVPFGRPTFYRRARAAVITAGDPGGLTSETQAAEGRRGRVRLRSTISRQRLAALEQSIELEYLAVTPVAQPTHRPHEAEAGLAHNSD